MIYASKFIAFIPTLTLAMIVNYMFVVITKCNFSFSGLFVIVPVPLLRTVIKFER